MIYSAFPIRSRHLGSSPGRSAWRCRTGRGAWLLSEVQGVGGHVGSAENRKSETAGSYPGRPASDER